MNKILILMTLATLAVAQTFNVSTTPELRTALATSATNGEDDTIILADGTYKTTDDGNGTFIYLSNEANNLTLKGSSSANVILSGDHVEQIFNHNSTVDAPLKLEKLTFVDGNNTATTSPDYNGGGVYSDYSVDVVDCNFTNNSASRYGGGFYSTTSATSATTVTNSTFTNNSATDGGGFYSHPSSSSSSTTVTNSTFTNNSARDYGGGFYSVANNHTTTVTNSTFTNNSAYSSGGGFYSESYSESSSSTTVTNSTFTNNSAHTGGGFSSYYSTTVTNSTFTNNSAHTGGGFSSASYSSSSTTTITVTNSTFTNNSARDYGGGFYSYYSTTVTNSTFTNNSARDYGGGFYSYYSVKASNLLLLSNSSGIYIYKGDNSKIYNSIFKDNNSSDINGDSGTTISHLENNYIDISKVNVSNFPKNNIFSGVHLGFVDEANGDYNLTASSDLIDAGTTTVNGITLPTTDLNGNIRIAGANIDIGPYEFSTTRPTIKSFNYTGIAKETNQLTFSVDYNLTDGRTLSDVMYEYTNDGSWTVDNNHTYNIAGVYIVKVKVTDDSGEYSTRKLTVNIAQITLTDKLLATLTQAQVDAILPMINSDKDRAVSEAHASGVTVGENNVVLDPASYNLVTQTAHNTALADMNTTATASGIATGKSYVQSHPSEFSLVTQTAHNTALADMNTTATKAGENLVIASPSAYGLVSSKDVNISVSEALATGTASGKQYVKDHPHEFGLVVKSNMELTASNISALSTGWTLVSTPFAITDMSIFDSASVVWVYNNSTSAWSAYSSDATMKQKIIDKAGINLLTSVPAGSGIWIQK